jgi:hypothetical protein
MSARILLPRPEIRMTIGLVSARRSSDDDTAGAAPHFADGERLLAGVAQNAEGPIGIALPPPERSCRCRN